MAKYFIEDFQIKTTETHDFSDKRFSVEDDKFVTRLVERIEFFSDIHRYEDSTVGYIKKEDVAGSGTYCLAINGKLFGGEIELTKVEAKTDVFMKRTGARSFYVISVNTEHDYGFIEFCNINAENQVSRARVNYTKLIDIQVFNNTILVNSYEKVEEQQKVIKLHSLILYDLEGKIKNTIIDRRIGLGEGYKFEIANGFLFVFVIKNGKDKVYKKINLDNLLK